MNVTIAITGASGSIYARQVIELLLECEQVGKITVIFSNNGKEVFTYEGEQLPTSDKIYVVSNHDFYTHTVSGSSCDDVMIIVPCSVGMMSRIACGISDDAISRSADVILKERKKLIVVLRETPLNLIHIDNMKRLTEAGAIIMPASPSFYSGARSMEDICLSVSNRVVSMVGFSVGYKWGEKSNHMVNNNKK